LSTVFWDFFWGIYFPAASRRGVFFLAVAETFWLVNDFFGNCLRRANFFPAASRRGCFVFLAIAKLFGLPTGF
jgi:hypothetical protein